jgi:hypothetical protein
VKDFVSIRWIRLAGMAASVAVIGGLFFPNGFPWIGLGTVSLALLGALWLRARSPRSMAQVIDDVDGEPAAVFSPVVVVRGAKKRLV